MCIRDSRDDVRPDHLRDSGSCRGGQVVLDETRVDVEIVGGTLRIDGLRGQGGRETERSEKLQGRHGAPLRKRR